MMLRNTLNGMDDSLPANNAPPFYVNHTFVEFRDGTPCEICTWIGSKGSFSFDQK